MKKSYRISYIFIILNLFFGATFAQKLDLKESISLTNQGRYSDAIASFKLIDTSNADIEDKALWLFYLGYTYNLSDQQGLAFQHMAKAKTIYVQLEKLSDVKDCNLQLLSILSHQNDLEVDKQSIIRELEDFISNTGNEDLNVKYRVYREIGTGYLASDLIENAEEVFRKSYKLSSSKDDSLQMSFDLMNIGTVKKRLKLYDSSLYYTKKGLPYLLKINDSLNISYNYNNQAEAYKYLNDYNKSLSLFLKADSILPNENKVKSKIIFYENMADLYEKTQNFKEAYLATKTKNHLEDSVNDIGQNLAIESIRNRYAAAEKEEQLKVEQQKKKQNRNIALGLGGGIVAISIFAFLVYKNTRRKQRIAEQEKELEIQKKEKILKDQELNAIDAMIEGQEKERQRLASDLHDSVGATLSAAKLQFDHIAKNRGKLESMDELFEKTGSLLEEAYTEVRSMAHLKNSGVIATKGLLPAVEKLAKNASSSNGLSIEVQGFGLTEKLEGPQEIAIFRMIQELVTNIIKHAEATEAHISITQHDDMLNIIVEDNGKGFNPRKMKRTEGMGLHSIEKRVEHLEGSLEVDAAPGRGTNILIDIPL
ncbi:sensor histidine kinase [Aureisphaera galaxeae]|uniref:tetratricopeptide repeat-containing sensor histidine kinase n=1 Tax=Aureisphaera galaxeae TaxID=1538023 RepID=UPI002350B716|nr:sensor histidine kinase [Aureisphaera galaxeae]MDC8006225.1 sensor histidine kinase [Aureisphaera galaxeae]